MASIVPFCGDMMPSIVAFCLLRPLFHSVCPAFSTDRKEQLMASCLHRQNGTIDGTEWNKGWHHVSTD